jgi:hypothetical protein
MWGSEKSGQWDGWTNVITMAAMLNAVRNIHTRRIADELDGRYLVI